MQITQNILLSRQARDGTVPPTIQALQSDPEPDTQWPHQMTTLARFILVLETYLILRFAVKYRNIEAVEHILPLIAILFLGSNKHKCARETLYLM